MDNTFLIHITQALQLALHSELAYIEGKGLFTVEYYKGQPSYTSLDGTTTLLDLPDGLKVYHLNNKKDVAELMRNVGGTSPLRGRNVSGTWSEYPRYAFANTSLSAEQEKIAEKYNIYDISESYQNEYLKQILREIRKLSVEAIEKAIRNKKGKREILLLWEQTQEKAEENSIIDLEDIREKLLKLAGKQKRAENATLIREAKKEIREEVWGKVKRTLKIWTLVVLFFVSISLGIAYSIVKNQKQSNQIKSEQTSIKPQSNAIKTNQTHIITEQDIIKAISKYNQTQSKRNQIYQWRKQKIIEALRGKQMSKQKLQDTIKIMARTNFWK